MPIPRPTCRLTIQLPAHLLEGPAIELLEYVCEKANKAWPKLNKIIGGLRYANHSERIEYDDDGNPYVARMVTPQRKLVAANRGLRRAGFSIEKPHAPSWYLSPIQRGPTPPAEDPKPEPAPKVEEKPGAGKTVYQADWGDDANDGLTPETPKKTHQGALAACEDTPGQIVVPLKEQPNEPLDAPPPEDAPATPEAQQEPQPTASPKDVVQQMDAKAKCFKNETGKWIVQDGKGVVIAQSTTARGAWQGAAFKLNH